MVKIDTDTDSGKPLLNVLNGQVPSRRPIWFMRQAGRYLEEYRKVREKAGSFLDLCYNPDMAAEVTLQPLSRFDIDAAILFSDILVIPQAMGCDLGFVQNEGPKLSTVKSLSEVENLVSQGAAEKLAPVYETVRNVKTQLPRHVSFIGFCGAPWTVATYMIEGGSSPDRFLAKKAAFSGEKWFDLLIEKLVEVSIEYLVEQVKSGVEVIQIFDSWASDLPDLQREKYCYRPIAKIVDGLHSRNIHIPIIGFAKGLGAAQDDFRKAVSFSAIGVESSLPVKWINDNLIENTVVQGNLDPVLLDAGGEALKQGVRHIVSSLPKERHIFNLGHGIRQTTSVMNVHTMIDAVREFDS